MLSTNTCPKLEVIINCAKSLLEIPFTPPQLENGMSKEIHVPGFGFGSAGVLTLVVENSIAFASAVPPAQLENFKLKLLSSVSVSV